MTTPIESCRRSKLRAARTRVIAEKDIAEVASFIAAQSGRTAESVEAHLRWFLLENPARKPQAPLGFGLRSADQFVGCILCSPQAFRFGNKKILLMGSSSFYVDDRHRGQGGRIFLQYCRLGNQWPLFGTSANAGGRGFVEGGGRKPHPVLGRRIIRRASLAAGGRRVCSSPKSEPRALPFAGRSNLPARGSDPALEDR